MSSDYPPNWPEIAEAVKAAVGWRCQWCTRRHDPEAGFCLTVHHLDGDPSNCSLANLAAICQRCHLKAQGHLHRYGVPNALQPRLPGFGGE